MGSRSGRRPVSQTHHVDDVLSVDGSDSTAEDVRCVVQLTKRRHGQTRHEQHVHGEFHKDWDSNGWDRQAAHKGKGNFSGWDSYHADFRQRLGAGDDRGGSEKGHALEYITMNKQDLGDAEIERWLREHGDQKMGKLLGGPLNSVDFSQNRLTEAGVNAVVDLILKHRQVVQRLKFFKNRIRDTSGICKLIEDRQLGCGSDDGLSELHLSSNDISADGIEKLFASILIAKNRSGPFNVPIWLRLEQNSALAAEVQRLTEKFAKKGLHMCFEGNRNTGCSIRWCQNKADIHLKVDGDSSWNRW